MSFIDLNADIRWSEQEITQRMEAMIREHCSGTEELILHRKILGSMVAGYPLSDAERAEISAYAQVCADAQAAGRQAREDMALLAEVLVLEQARARLAQPAVEAIPDEADPALITNADAVYEDMTQREQAQAVVDAASAPAIGLADERAALAAESATAEPAAEPVSP